MLSYVVSIKHNISRTIFEMKSFDDEIGTEIDFNKVPLDFKYINIVSWFLLISVRNQPPNSGLGSVTNATLKLL